MPEVLPSVRFQADDPRPVGFLDQVDDAHLAAVRRAVGDVATIASEVRGDVEPKLRVRFSSVRYMPTLPFVLYSFHILRVNEDGDFSDELATGEEITYALVANHAVEVQREAAILFLYDLVVRQLALRPIASGESPQAQVDVVAAEADRRSKQEFRDRIRGGWAAATRAIAQQALDAGLALQVRYEVDVLPSREDVVRRMRVLREAYNEIDIAREAVDKTVSLIGGRDPRVSAIGLTQADEDKIQRQLSSMNVRLWVSQTTRDAEVCGNGYLVTREAPILGLYNLRPEAVEVVAPDTFLVERDGGMQPVDGHVLHVKGIEQFTSPYGISILEPVLAEHRTRRTFREAKTFAERVLRERGPDSSEGHWARETIPLAERSLAASDERLGRLLAYPRDWIRDARAGLYFPGQDRM